MSDAQDTRHDPYLSDGELGYWRACYRDQLARANAAEADVERLSMVTNETVRLFLAWMEGAFVGTPEAMRLAVKQAMTKAIAGEECPYG